MPLSREERKLQAYVAAFAKMEAREQGEVTDEGQTDDDDDDGDGGGDDDDYGDESYHVYAGAGQAPDLVV